jgi:hypothetical protein
MLFTRRLGAVKITDYYAQKGELRWFQLTYAGRATARREKICMCISSRINRSLLEAWSCLWVYILGSSLHDTERYRHTAYNPENPSVPKVLQIGRFLPNTFTIVCTYNFGDAFGLDYMLQLVSLFFLEERFLFLINKKLLCLFTDSHVVSV